MLFTYYVHHLLIEHGSITPYKKYMKNLPRLRTLQNRLITGEMPDVVFILYLATIDQVNSGNLFIPTM